MNIKVFGRSVVAAVLIAIISFGASVRSNAQESRPRYSSRQYGERTWTVPDDTVITVSINDNLNSKSSRVGDRFTATVTAPVYADGREVVPAGAIVEGRVTQVTPARRMGKSGAIAIDFDDLVFPNGSRIAIVGNLTSTDPDTQQRIDDESRVSGDKNKRSAVFIGSSGAIGAVLGGIAGGGKGAMVGGVLGAGAGVAAVLLSKGEEATVPSGTPFGIQLRQPLVVRETFLSQGGTVVGRDTDTTDTQPYRRDADPVDAQPDRSVSTNPQPDRSQPDTVNNPVRDTEPTDASNPAMSGPSLPLSSPEMIRRAQIALKEQGYYEGQADGSMNPRTSAALKVFQREHKLPETGNLDEQTAKSLGILAASSASNRTPARSNDISRDTSGGSDVILADVLSATAARTQEGAIHVAIDTQANTGGWRWYGDHVVNGDTLEVYARAVRPTGIVTQALTRGRIELNVRDRVEYVRRVVIHTAKGNQVITLAGRPSPASGDRINSATATSIQRQAEELLSEYQRISGVRLTGTTVELDNRSRNREPEIELLFAIDSFVNASQLYARLSSSLQDQRSLRSATLEMARQARRTDRVISTSASQTADAIAGRWDGIRQDVLKLMQTYNINTSELDN